MKSKKIGVTPRRRRLFRLVTGLSALLIILTSCQVHRVLTNTAESFTKGDSTIVIQTKVTESYIGKKQL